ncbi:hypothetical protein [Brevibacterium sp. ZH18]|uniref:hypothetical protein n=1 Tax=Brevibacterium sp. ZH18 TaxID=2927784 RepID=UPI001F60E2B7|nr:hypothetical protein [Brevibacterium sp. ZH18]
MAVAVLVISALSVVGTDEETETKAFSVKDGSYAVVLDEAIVPYAGTSVTVEAKNSQGTDLFLGTANGVDADSFLDGVAQEQISDVQFPNEVDHRAIPGDPAPAADITSRDWWTSQDTGQSVAKTFDLDADPQVLVIAPANADENLDGTTVTLKMRVAGVFALSLIGIALGIILAGLAAFFFLRWFNSRIRPQKKTGLPGGESTLTDEATANRGTSMAGTRRTRPRPAADDDRGRADEPPEHSSPEPAGAGAEPSSETAGPDARPNPEPADTNSGSQAPPRRRDLRRKGSLRIATAITLGSGLALSGCSALPVAQPDSPNITPYERTAVRPGEAGTFMTNYTESLDKILDNGGTDLESIQGEPIIDRTRAQIQIAEKAKQHLRAPNFTEVVAGGPSFEKYPMWFYAFGTTESDGKKLTQVQLVTRESASTQPIVRTASYIPADQMPTLLADGSGAVKTGPKAFNDTLPKGAEAVSSYLVDGKADGSDFTGLNEGGFKDFRDYLDGLRDKDSGFDKVDVECKPYTDFDFGSMTLSTEHGAIGLGEARCTLTIKVPDDYSVDLGDTIEAVKTNDKKGNTVKVETSHPYVLMKIGDKMSVVATDWNVLSSRIE